MRQLSILREKTFVASLGKIRIYAEDPAAPELTINGVPCRFLGVLNNGEEKTFEIGEEETRIFAIASKIEKSICTELYRVPAGSEPVRLSGKCRFNPSAGNAFRFYDNFDEEALKYRKTASRRGLLILILALVFGLGIGFFAGRALASTGENDPKEFTKQGMHITLTQAFSEQEAESYTVAYSSKSAVVLAVREAFSLAEGSENLSLSEYAELVRLSNAQIGEDDEPRSENGLIYYEYSFEDPNTKAMLRYLVAMYKTSDAFWMFNFATDEPKYDALRPTFLKWAKSVRFD